MFMQLNPPIPLATPKGKAWAIGMIDYGPQWDLQWVTFLHETGECWTFDNKQIRQEENYTFGLPKPSPIHTAPTAKPVTDTNHINNGRERIAIPNGVNGSTSHYINGKGHA